MSRRKHFILIACLMILGVSNLRAQDSSKHWHYWKSDSYFDTTVQGWTVYVNSKLLSHPFWLSESYKRLDKELSYVENHMPSASITPIKEIPIWLEIVSTNGVPLQFHHGGEWLNKNGYDPAKENSVEIMVHEFINGPDDQLYVMFEHEWTNAIKEGYEPLDTNKWRTNEPPITLRPPQFGFYAKEINCNDIPLKSSAKVSDAALIIACFRIQTMLADIPNVDANLKNLGAEFHIFGRNEVPSDLPENSSMRGKQIQAQPDEPVLDFDVRETGAGGLMSYCSEANILHSFNDGSRSKDICVHEFAHTIFMYGLSQQAREAISEQFDESRSAGLWRGNYALENSNEFFAELSMWYFGTHGDQMKSYVGIGKESFKKYDPKAYSLLDSIYSGRFSIPFKAYDTIKAISVTDKYVSHSGDKCTLLFKNCSEKPVEILWVGFNGKRKSYGTISPGHFQLQQTFVSHPFVIKDENGHDKEEFIAPSGNSLAIIQ